MRKRLLSILLALTLTLGLAGCAANLNDGETSAADADYSTEIFGKDVITTEPLPPERR